MLSAGLGAAVWGVTGEPLAVPLAVASGVLVDADHLLDQTWYFYLHRRPAALLVLHAWEWLTALVAACLWLWFPWWLVAVTVGYAGHLATDQRFNHVYRKGYFITYRAYHGYNIDRLTPDWRLEPPLEALAKELAVLRRLWRWVGRG
jgi:hypothetical protein